MRTTLARQLRRLFNNQQFIEDTADFQYLAISTCIANFREAHPRKPKAKPAKLHRRSKNRR